MSMAILKSPTLIHQRLNLNADHAQPEQGHAVNDGLRASIETQVKAELELQFKTRIEAIKDDAKAEGYKQGLAEGHQDGMASALDAFKHKQALLEEVLTQAEAQVETWLQSVMAQATDIAKEALCLFIGEQAINPVILQNIIKQVSSGLRESDVMMVRLHPAECQVLRHALRQSGAQTGARLADKIQEDPALLAGGVAIDTPRGEYRATLDVQLKKLLALLDEQRASLNPSAPVYHALRA